MLAVDCAETTFRPPPRTTMDNDTELRSMRVIVRVRPAADEGAPVAVTCGEALDVDCGGGKRFAGAFADILGPSASQADVYGKIEDVVLQTTDGINACVLAYGQTGAGKTHTMLSGGGEDGIVPRALRSLFAKLGEAEPPTPGGATPAPRAAKVSLSLLQILGERLDDLLAPHSEVPLRVRLASHGSDELYVSGLSSVVVDDADAALTIVRRGLRGRRERATQRNDASSRSHAVLRVDIEKRDDLEVVKSRLYLVDLAGSERASALDDDDGNPSETQRFREHVDINQSLSALGNVVAALSDGPTKRPHVPYRDSTLTRLLQDSLGGNTRTAIVACCAPETAYADETVSTLKFADRAQRVLARVYANRDVAPASDSALVTALKRAEEEIRRLKEALLEKSEAPPSSAGSFVKEMQLVDVTKSLQAEVVALRAENAELRELLDPEAAAAVEGTPVMSRTAAKKRRKQRPPRPSSQPEAVDIVHFQQRLEKLDTVVGPRPASATRASDLGNTVASLEGSAASKMLAERQASIGEELSRDVDALERIKKEREEAEWLLADLEGANAAADAPPPTRTPPRRRRRRKKPVKEVAPIAPPSPEEPAGTLYGDARDVGARVEIFSFRFNRAYAGDVVSFDPKRGLHCVAYDDGDRKWHDLWDKSIKCLKAGNGRETPDALPPSTTPLSISHALARRGPPRRRPRRKKSNNPVAATGYITTSPCKGSEMLPQLSEMYAPGRSDAVNAQ